MAHHALVLGSNGGGNNATGDAAAHARLSPIDVSCVTQLKTSKEVLNMDLLIFGATGATGQHLVRLALSSGHRVTAFVRDPDRLTATSPSLRKVVGDVLQPASVEAALPGHDAVLCALGTMPEAKADRPRRQPEVPVCSVGTRNILDAMSKHQCRRIVVQSSTSVGGSRATGSLGAGAFVRTVLRDVMNDKELQEAAIRASTSDWTIVRPVRMTDGLAKGHVQSGERLRWNLLSSVSRADVAAYMLAAVADPALLRKEVTIKS